MYPDTAWLEQVQQFRCKMLEKVFKVGIFFQLMLCPQVVLNLGRNDFSQVNWSWRVVVRAASVPVSTSCLWCLPASLRIGSWWRTLDSARMAPKRATTLVLLVTISTQVSPCCDLVASGILSLFVSKK